MGWLEDKVNRAHQEQEDLIKSSLGDISKARSGIYANTPENKKLGRVGQKYGGKKQEADSKKESADIPDDFELVGNFDKLKAGEKVVLKNNSSLRGVSNKEFKIKTLYNGGAVVKDKKGVEYIKLYEDLKRV